MGGTLLLLIDLQRSFCDPDGSMAKQGRDVTPMRAAAEVCEGLARQAHAAAIPVVWTRMMFRDDYGDGGLLTRTIRPNLARIGALRAGTADVELSAAIQTMPGDLVIDKPRYSAVYGTPLEVELRARRIDRILVGGVTTSMCVETTVRDLGQRDYETLVVREACGDFEAARHQASLDAMAFGFARVVTLAEVPQLLGVQAGG
jgi:ureidoacrylate peracid hydrolase